MKTYLYTSLFLISTLAVSGELTTIKSGNWSDPSCWSTGQLPGQGDNVTIENGHTITYDLHSDVEIRLLLVRGVLQFSRSMNTQLDAGLILIGSNPNLNIDLDCGIVQPGPKLEQVSALEVGTPDNPIPRPWTATIRLVEFADLNPVDAPGIINHGGRMDFHGAPLTHTWVKLSESARAGSMVVQASETLNWRTGDQVIVTRTSHPGTNFVNEGSFETNGLIQTEKRAIAGIKNGTVTLDRPLQFDHKIRGPLAGEIANLTRNVVITSKNPDGHRGHTMYHYGSSGSISYAEFSHLGKGGVLARYPVHFHLLRDSNRGSYVRGASIWDSHNRFVTIHGTDFLVVEDCVGYQSRGHGYFMEDASEVNNLFYKNLAVQAYSSKPLPNQALAYDLNEGAGFWWPNGLNAFIDNVATECDQYGFLFDIPEDINSVVTNWDGSEEYVRVSQLPFIRFRGNEVHGSLLYGMHMNGNADPDAPFIVEDLRVWDSWYAFTPDGNNTYIKNLDIRDVAYGYYGTEPKNTRLEGYFTSNPGNFAMGFRYRPQGLMTFEDVRIDSCPEYPFRIFGNKKRKDPATIHIRDYHLTNIRQGFHGVDQVNTALKQPQITLFLHDFFTDGKDAKVIPSTQPRQDGLTYETMHPPFAEDVRVAVVDEPWPQNPIEPVDRIPPASVILLPRDRQTFPAGTKTIVVEGTSIDANKIASLKINGINATAVDTDFLRWRAELTAVSDGIVQIQAEAVDEFGNKEVYVHSIRVGIGTSVSPVEGNPGDDARRIALATSYTESKYELVSESGKYAVGDVNLTIRIPEHKGTSYISLIVIDEDGRDIANLTDQDYSPGEYTFQWDGRNFSGKPADPGFYQFQMLAQSRGDSEQVMLVRDVVFE